MQRLLRTDRRQTQRLLPVVSADGRLVGVLTRGDLRDRIEQEGHAAPQRVIGDLVRKETVIAHPDEPLRVVVCRMTKEGLTRLPVVEPGSEKFLGLVSLNDLLKARGRHLEEESRRERTLELRSLLPGSRVVRDLDEPVVETSKEE